LEFLIGFLNFGEEARIFQGNADLTGEDRQKITIAGGKLVFLPYQN
jgi:hypothetical protein